MATVTQATVAAVAGDAWTLAYTAGGTVTAFLQNRSSAGDLLVRVGEIIAERTGDTSELKHLSTLTGPRSRSAMTKRSQQSSRHNGDSPSIPVRTFMKL